MNSRRWNVARFSIKEIYFALSITSGGINEASVVGDGCVVPKLLGSVTVKHDWRLVHASLDGVHLGPDLGLDGVLCPLQLEPQRPVHIIRPPP